MSKFLACAVLLGAALGIFGYHFSKPYFAASEVLKTEEFVFSKTLTGVGYMNQGHRYLVNLSDGRVVLALRFRFQEDGWIAQIEPGLWVRGVA